MKALLFTLTLACGLMVTPLWAQESPAPTEKPKAGKAGKAAKEPVLTPEEQKQLKDARNKAMSDPSVKKAKEAVTAANKELMAAMLEKDPSLKDILNTLFGFKDPETAKNVRKKSDPDYMDYVKKTRSDLKKAVALRDSMEGQPVLEKQKAAIKAQHEARDAAAVKIDPAVKPLLEKVKAAMKTRKPGPKDPMSGWKG